MPDVWPDKWATTEEELTEQARLVIRVNDMKKSTDVHVLHIGKVFKEARIFKKKSLFDIAQTSGIDPLRIHLTEQGYGEEAFEVLTKEEFVRAGLAMDIIFENWERLLPKEKN